MAKELVLEIDDEVVKCKLPESWEDINVRQYQKIIGIDREGKTDIQLFVNILTAMTGLDDELFYMIPVDEFNKLTETLSFTLDEIKSEMADSVTINGEEYFLKKDFDKLTMGETISVEAILKESDNNLELVIDKMLCIFLRKKKENGKLETFKNSFMDRQESFGDVKITDVHNLFVFFSIGSPS